MAIGIGGIRERLWEMILNKILGAFMVAIPFLVIFYFMIKDMGWKVGLQNTLLAVAMTATVFGGVTLMRI
jgi:Na+/H+ antiporter NhaD/arsenite permease-like protein